MEEKEEEETPTAASTPIQQRTEAATPTQQSIVSIEKKCYVLRIFKQVAKDERCKQYHNKYLLPSSIVKIMNAHCNLKITITDKDFAAAMNKNNVKLLLQEGLLFVKKWTQNWSNIFSCQHNRKQVYYMKNKSVEYALH